MKPTTASTALAAILAAASLMRAAPGSAASLESALASGTLDFDARLRWEYADQSNLREADAVTLRTLFGFTSAPLYGLRGMIEGENVAALNDPNDYNAAGSNPGGAGRTVIADAPVTDLNQAWLRYAFGGTALTAGRQRIVLDNARFVGDVGWRQNMQTFDAATVTSSLAPGLNAFYGYVSRVSRVFGNKAPQPDFDSDSHLLNVSYSGFPYGKLTAYAYLLDFRNSAANSSNTFGASFAGAAPLAPRMKLTYRLEAATQRDARNNPLHYSARYLRGDLGAVVAPLTLAVGFEELGSDAGRKGFATPLATLHAFNGWADEFLVTPASGLRDTYGSVGFALPGGVPVTVVYHDFHSDFGSLDYGSEWDAVITHKIGKHWTLLAKGARFDGKHPYFDTKKFWLQTEYRF